MKISYKWLQEYFTDSLPAPEDLAKKITDHAYQVESLMAVGDDIVFDIDILPHRSHDSLSYIGVAKEVATILDREPKLPELDFNGDDTITTSDHVALSVEDPRLVRRATKRFVQNVKVGPSPEWLVERLTTMGQRSINNIVDITNFVMFETGQPVHAFDYDKLSGSGIKNITIRHARAGEKITTLDGVEHSLDESMLVIADDEKALDIAGIKGGSVSGIDENTTRVVLSVCNFNPTNIRKTRTKLKISTDASKRFEQEITPEHVRIAMNRLSQLVAEIAGGTVSADVAEYYPRQPKRFVSGFATSEVNKLLGTTLSDDQVRSVLVRMERAGFEWKEVDPVLTVFELGRSLAGKEYKYGASISYDAPNAFDCSSLVSYLYSQAGIQIPRVTVDQFAFSEEIGKDALRVGDLVFSRNGGLDDELSYTSVTTGDTVSQKTVHDKTKEFMPGFEIAGGISHVGVYMGDGNILHASKKAGKVVLEELATSDRFREGLSYRSVIHSSFFALGERYVVTVPHERLDLRARGTFFTSGIKEELIEEIGRLYGYENISVVVPVLETKPTVNKIFYYQTLVRNFLVEQGFSEVYTYALVDKGDVELANPMAEGRQFLRTNIAPTLVERVAFNAKNRDLLGLDQIKIFEFGKVFRGEKEILSLCLGVEKKKKGYKTDDAVRLLLELLELPAETSNYFAMTDETAELAFDEFASHLSEPDSPLPAMSSISSAKYKPFSPYPFIVRDIAVWVSGDGKEELASILVEEGGELLALTPKLFDEFSKDGKTSYGYRLVFQAKDRTLTDDEANSAMEKIYEKVKAKGWEVR